MKKTVEKTVKNAVKFKLIRSEEDKNAIKEAIEIRNAIEMKERIKEVVFSSKYLELIANFEGYCILCEKLSKHRGREKQYHRKSSFHLDAAPQAVAQRN